MLGADCLKYVFLFFVVLFGGAMVLACTNPSPATEVTATAKCGEPDGSVTEYSGLSRAMFSGDRVYLYPTNSKHAIVYHTVNCTVTSLK